ncbi:MAG: hypothetical protein FJZ05_02280 [Candidatus Nealsonbacteria bacterium]|nr:hypothetical protein [Candidatus Nealsonbacteria bacterium]
MAAPIVPAAVAAARTVATRVAARAAAARTKIAKAAKDKLAESAKSKITEAATSKKGGWFQKIPKDILLSPGGAVLIFLAFLIEVIDWIPLPVVDQIIELPLELLFLYFFVTITKSSYKSLLIPFAIERIPVISDILPTWLLRMFV